MKSDSDLIGCFVLLCFLHESLLTKGQKECFRSMSPDFMGHALSCISIFLNAPFVFFRRASSVSSAGLPAPSMDQGHISEHTRPTAITTRPADLWPGLQSTTSLLVNWRQSPNLIPSTLILLLMADLFQSTGQLFQWIACLGDRREHFNQPQTYQRMMALAFSQRRETRDTDSKFPSDNHICLVSGTSQGHLY